MSASLTAAQQLVAPSGPSAGAIIVVRGAGQIDGHILRALAVAVYANESPPCVIAQDNDTLVVAVLVSVHQRRGAIAGDSVRKPSKRCASRLTNRLQRTVMDQRAAAEPLYQADMTDRPQHDARWAFASGTLITIGCAIIVVLSARSYGRTVGFAFGVNWILAAWAISSGRVLQSRSGAWDGLSVRLPASYYATRPFEKGGCLYDYLGVRWYQRLLRPVFWSVEPTRLRSQGARQTMIRETQNPEAGHLLIFVVIVGITFWAVVSGWWDTAAWLLLFNGRQRHVGGATNSR